MTNVKFLHQPGYLYDLITIFVLRYNKELWLDYYANPDNTQEDLAYLKSVTEEFPIDNEDLSIFFSEDEVKGNFFTEKYYFEYSNKMISEYDFDFLISEILDKNKFAKKLLDFYLPNSELEVDFDDNRFLQSLVDQLNESYYTDKTKNKIISFFISPEKFLIPLAKEITDKNAILTKFYQKNFKRIVDTQEKFDFYKFSEKLKNIEDESPDCKEIKNIHISICLICKNIINHMSCDNCCLLLIGFDYEDTINGKYANKSRFEVDNFGKIISDQNRIEVINMLTSVPELSTSDIAKNLGISINAAYYHLDMMSQADMLSIRSEGRTVYYRLNRSYIAKAVESVGRMFVKK